MIGHGGGGGGGEHCRNAQKHFIIKTYSSFKHQIIG